MSRWDALTPNTPQDEAHQAHEATVTTPVRPTRDAVPPTAAWDEPHEDAAPAAVSPPIALLIAAAAAATASIGLALLAWSSGTAMVHGLVGWILAGPLAGGCIALFTVKDAARRADVWYRPSELAPILRTLALGLGVCGVVANGWFIAEYAARRVPWA